MDAIQSAYSLFESLNLSVTSLVVIALVLSLAFLFSVREAAAWFFKINDMKRELKYLSEAALRIEGEITAMQDILAQARNKQDQSADGGREGGQPTAGQQGPSAAQEMPVKESSSTGFPIVH